VTSLAGGFEGIALLLPHLKPAGALLLLRQPSDVAAVEILNGQVEVEVRPGVAAIVVRGLDASDAPGVIAEAPEYANRALDIIGMRGRSSIALDDVSGTNVTWWHDGTEQVVRLLSTSTMSFSGSATIEVRDANGDLVPPPPEQSPIWHESMRYFRMSQTTDDLFDAFRNIYLSLESVLSHSAPVHLNAQGRPTEREGDWLKRALTVATQSVNLKMFLRNPGAAATDGVDEVYQELYIDVRTAIFHAKSGRPVLLPQDLSQRELVADAKERYARLYLALAEQTFNTRFLLGGPTTYAASEIGKAVAREAKVAVTSDTTPASSHDNALSPNGELVHAFTAVHAPELDEPFVMFHKGNASSAMLTPIDSVSRFGSIHDQTGELLIVDRLPGSLALAGFERVEVVIGVRIASGNAPRTRYAT